MTTATLATPSNLNNHADAPPVVVQQPLQGTVPNRYQKRKHSDESVASLAENIRQHGLKQIPVGRWHPDQPGVVEFADGHRRRAAFQLLAKSDAGFVSIPVQILPLTDRELYETCVITNEQREPLSPIERAVSLRDYMAEFGVSQETAGKLFNIGQTAVSHLTHMLELPERVQDLIDGRELSENAARSLGTLIEWHAPNDPDFGRGKVIAIAAKAVSNYPADVGARTANVETLIDETLRRENVPVLTNGHITPWPLEWPGKPIPVPTTRMLKDRDTPNQVPACVKCPFNLRRGSNRYCLRPACHAVKFELWTAHEVELAAARLGIAAAGPDEQAVIVPVNWRGGYDYARRQKLTVLVATKLPILRLTPRKAGERGGYDGDDFGRMDIFGSLAVELATVDQAAVAKIMDSGESVKKAPPAKSAHETALQKERRINAERELAEERKLERMAYNRAKADVLWIVEHTAELIAARTVAGGGLLGFVAGVIEGRYPIGSNYQEFSLRQDDLAQRAQLPGAIHIGGAKLIDDSKPVKGTPELDPFRRQYVAFTVIAHDLTMGYNYGPTMKTFGNFQGARERCVEVATENFEIELPAGWDTPPIHRTPINCWTCGRFSAAGTGKLTQGDAKEGWRAAFVNKDGVLGPDAPGAKLEGVWCPEHAKAGIDDWSRAHIKATNAKKDPAFDAPAVSAVRVKRGEPVVRVDMPPAVSVAIPSFAPAPAVKSGIRKLIHADETAAARKLKRSIAAKSGAGNRKPAPKAKYGRSHTPAPKSNARAAAKATASARELAAKLKPNGRGHTRPAPKPAAKRRKVAKKGSK